jgi:hypothetical protein
LFAILGASRPRHEQGSGVAAPARATVTDADVAAALDELLGETGALTRAFLGVRRPGDPEPVPDPHAWMRGGWTSAG